MSGKVVTFRNGRVFDGERLHDGHVARFEDGQLAALIPEADAPYTEDAVDLGGDILSAGYVDLQVNGGGGVMLNDDPSVETLKRMVDAHRNLGVAAILPTLITDTREVTAAAIAAAIEATQRGLAGVAGLHLEGPHLSLARKGAHDPALIRPMEPEDFDNLLAAARALPALMVTVAPESVSEAQVAALSRAGVIVSIGHTNADFETCQRYAAAGARVATHLFNAMSQLGSREPGLVGAALANGALSAGLIADAIHVHPATMRAAWASKAGPGRIFLVSDAMAVAGSDLSEFRLGGRMIRRNAGRLTLEDGTLAGADLDLTTAVRNLVGLVGVGLEDALRAAITVPAALIRRKTVAGQVLGDMIRIAPDLSACRPAI
ncbi:N-acetylglucosamine-6-phosphate deacetylase [Amaricoccus macauensis]|uniref:N-acetylglucosamine-6-phosphate deacetylase n=1 Tax=Amaricoccus macauensis TaxID=57001 RepID=UPI003C7B6928